MPVRVRFPFRAQKDRIYIYRGQLAIQQAALSLLILSQDGDAPMDHPTNPVERNTATTNECYRPISGDFYVKRWGQEKYGRRFCIAGK